MKHFINFFRKRKYRRKSKKYYCEPSIYLPKGEKAENIERTESEVKTVGNTDCIDADVLEKFDYSALGHIHKPMKVGSETIRYCGTPMAYSVSEAGQEKGILMVDIGEKGTGVKVTNLPLKPMRNVRIEEGKFEELIKKYSKEFCDCSIDRY